MTLEGGALVLADQVGLNKIVNPCLLMLFKLLNMEISEVFFCYYGMGSLGPMFHRNYSIINNDITYEQVGLFVIQRNDLRQRL